MKPSLIIQKNYPNCVRNCSFSKDSSYLITANDDKTIKLFALNGFRYQYSLKGHKNWVNSANFTKFSNSSLVSGGYDKKLIFWDLET